MLLKLAKLPRSSYYYAVERLKAAQTYGDERATIRLICEEHKGRYGYRRVALALREKGFETNHKLVMKLMKAEGLTCQLRRKRYRPNQGHEGRIAPNLLDQDFTTEQPNQKWATDVTEFNLLGKRLYLSPILDLFNGEVISYNVSRSASFELVMTMLKKAFQTLPDRSGLILHSDQGWQYQMKTYQRLLAEKGIRQSMSRRGNCYDNAVIENFFGMLKSEFFKRQIFASVEDFQEKLSAYLDYWNNDRIKVKLNGLSPVAYRAQSVIST